MYRYQIDVVRRWSKGHTVQTVETDRPLSASQAGDIGEKHCGFGKAVVIYDDPDALTWGPMHKGEVRTVVLFCQRDEQFFGHLGTGWAD